MFTNGFTGTVYQGETITCEVDGFTVTATIHRDDEQSCPWTDEDGHGPVSDWTRRTKRPGERVLCTDRGSRRFYDIQEATAVAKREGWGPRLPWRTPGQARAAAVEADYQRLRAWCKDEWCYVVVAVTVAKAGVELTDKYDHALWGIESDATDHLTEVANDYIREALDAARDRLATLIVELTA